MKKDWMQQLAENAEKAQYIRAVFSPEPDCNSCFHYRHLYDDEQLHTLDDMTDCWYEPVAVYGCTLQYDGFECDYKPLKSHNNGTEDPYKSF